MSIENLNFLREVIDNALTGQVEPESLVRALEVIEEMLTEAGESDGAISTKVQDNSDANEEVVEESVAVADSDDIPF